MGQTKNDSTQFTVSAEDIKYANLIFVEHSKLLKENTLLYKQINNYQIATNAQSKIDSIKNIEIRDLRNVNSAYQYKIDNLEEQFKKEKQSSKVWKIGCLSVSALLLVFIVR